MSNIVPPDYTVWLKHDSFNRDELGLLIVGVDPGSEIGKEMANTYGEESYQNFTNKHCDNNDTLQTFETYLSVDSLINRSLEGGAFKSYSNFNNGFIPREKAIAFACETDMCCKDFVLAIKAWAEKKFGTPKEKVQNKPAIEKPLMTKERETFLKLIIGMAVGGYGYDPTASKSTITNDIYNDLALHGIQLDQDTIRNKLKEAAQFLSVDSKAKPKSVK